MFLSALPPRDKCVQRVSLSVSHLHVFFARSLAPSLRARVGFKALKPPFTVVMKDPQGLSPDQLLPSVMTCQNYFKLPTYSSKEVLRERLLTAITEGQGSFDLS